MSTYHGEPYPGFFKDASAIVAPHIDKVDDFELTTFSVDTSPTISLKPVSLDWVRAPVTAFIAEHRRFPNEEEFEAIRDEHGPFSFGKDDFTIEFHVKVDQDLINEWNDLHLNAWPVSVGFQADENVSWKDAVETAIKQDFELPSALLSPKGTNKHNIDNELI